MDLLTAIENDDTSLVRSLIQSIDVKETEETFLIFAIIKGNIDIVRLLIEAGADINKKDRNGASSFIYAVIKGNIVIVRLLIEAGADTNIYDGDGMTPLMIAAENNDIPLVRLLIQNGADINKQDPEGLTVLDYCDSTEMYDYLSNKTKKTLPEVMPMVMPMVTSRSYSGECGVCLEPIIGKGCRVNCGPGHVFHCDCINEWVNTRKVSLNTTDSDNIIDTVRNPRTGEMEPMYASHEILSSRYNDTCPLCRAKITEMYYVNIPEGFTTGFGKKRNGELKYLYSFLNK